MRRVAAAATIAGAHSRCICRVSDAYAVKLEREIQGSLTLYGKACPEGEHRA